MSKEPYDPIPLILELFEWAIEGVRRFEGTPNEAKFRDWVKQFEDELKKYLIE